MADDEEQAKTTYEYKDGEQETSEWCSRAGLVKITYPNGDTFEGDINDLKKTSWSRQIYSSSTCQ